MNKEAGNNTLEHAVIHAPDYGRVDGRQAGPDNTAALALGLLNGPAVSIGEGAPVPLYRVLDAAAFALSAMAHLRESYRYPQGYDPNKPVLARLGLQGAAMSVTVNTGDDDITRHLTALADALSRDGDMLGERLSLLKRLLDDLGY